jgi:hypothetical protein
VRALSNTGKDIISTTYEETCKERLVLLVKIMLAEHGKIWKIGFNNIKQQMIPPKKTRIKMSCSYNTIHHADFSFVRLKIFLPIPL